MCETRDLGIKWPHWHTSTFEVQVQSGHEIRLPNRREEDVVGTGKINSLEGVGSEARECRAERRVSGLSSSGSVANEDKGGMD